jgi:hypothetical protein
MSTNVIFPDFFSSIASSGVNFNPQKISVSPAGMGGFTCNADLHIISKKVPSNNDKLPVIIFLTINNLNAPPMSGTAPDAIELEPEYSFSKYFVVIPSELNGATTNNDLKIFGSHSIGQPPYPVDTIRIANNTSNQIIAPVLSYLIIGV